MRDRIEDLLSFTGEGDRLTCRLVSIMKEHGVYEKFVSESARVLGRREGSDRNLFGELYDHASWNAKKNLPPAVQVEIIGEIRRFLSKYCDE